MSLKNSLFLSVFLWIALNGNSQETQSSDSTGLVSFSDKILIKANLSTETDQHFLFDHSDNSKLKLTSNNSYKLFLSLDYTFIGVSFGFTPNFFSNNRDDELKGESSFNNFQFRFFLGHWIQSIQYKKIKGYYVENTEDFVDGWQKGIDPFIQIPTLKNVTWGMSTSYVFNPKFSFRNLIYQTEWQKYSTGSFVPTLYYDYNEISFDLEGTQSEDDSFESRLALAYYYTFVIEQHWFIAPNLSPALGVKFTKSRSVSNSAKDSEHTTYFTKFLQGGLQIGYSSNKVIFGGSFNVSVRRYNSDENAVTENDQIYGILYFGYRFDAPKFIDRNFRRLSKK